MIGFIFILLLIGSYALAFVSAMLVIPWLWIPIGIVTLLMGLAGLYFYRFKNRGVVAMGLFTVGTFVAFGQYLEYYLPAASIFINIFGVALSVIMMVLWYYFKEGHKRKEVRVKKEKFEVEEMKVKEVGSVRFLWRVIRRYLKVKKAHPYGNVDAWAIAYYEVDKELTDKPRMNAIDFDLARKVAMVRNEYDQTTDR